MNLPIANVSEVLFNNAHAEKLVIWVCASNQTFTAMITWQEPWYINKCDDRDVKRITEPDETSSFHRGVYIQTSYRI